MSATFKIAKKKYTQNDLRRLMNEQKAKVKQPSVQQKIESPLAKYNDAGQLTCILCKSIVRSESVWKVHVNSKQHKDNVTAAKQLKDKLEASKATFKRPADVAPSTAIAPTKKIKPAIGNGSLAVTDNQTQHIPNDFFDTKTSSSYFEVTLGKTNIKTNLINIKREQGMNGSQQTTSMEVDENKDDPLPEGFFDDPVKDAKVRNQEYKDPQDEEWDKFQRAIKEESTVSNAIIAEEQDEATAERQIEEIDEQIRKWSRVLDLERRKEDAATKFKTRSSNRMNIDEMESGSSEDESNDVDEFLDWRAKRSDRKV